MCSRDPAVGIDREKDNVERGTISQAESGVAGVIHRRPPWLSQICCGATHALLLPHYVSSLCGKHELTKLSVAVDS
jgi:hypothetical protein